MNEKVIPVQILCSLAPTKIDRELERGDDDQQQYINKLDFDLDNGIILTFFNL